MLRETFVIICRNWTVYLTVVVVLIALAIFDEHSGRTTSGGATSFVWSYIAMCVQGAVIHSETFSEAGKRSGFARSFPYFLKTAALLLAAIVISLPVFLVFPVAKGMSAGVFVFVATALIAYVLVLSLLGTWPTSNITGQGTSLVDALRRGTVRFFPTFGRLFVAIVLPLVLAVLLILVVSQFETSALLLVDGNPNILMLAVSAAAVFLQAASVSYVAVVLARVYISGERDSQEFGRAMA
ncbi:hypothetical protein ASC97_01885 [Rhizobium sp. Root1203]|uniref:hypothetical protein n=1 Tax=Rhizobium sp. Root1203 TaxID=1736427 RepID=UPI00070F51B0|nr:hypothetical protein [Rhizobium sp. Root1203]KQV32369.1 hypothetical protein ASC97_01885 [Rhizobium sp. Root1203]